ncbi:hypothetical protein INF26_03970, partial [Olsenella sp. DSM 107455]
MYFSMRISVSLFLVAALLMAGASPAFASEILSHGGELSAAEQPDGMLDTDCEHELTEVLDALEVPEENGAQGDDVKQAGDAIGTSVNEPVTEVSDSAEEPPREHETLYLPESLSLDACYEELKAYASKYYDDMPNPRQMSAADGIQSFATSPYWDDTTFYNGDGTVYLDHAARVIDVSEWQGVIDWDQVKASGVDAAIIRIGYGTGNEDDYAARNIAECERLGIPYGLYLYSYAYDDAFAKEEAIWTAALIDRYGADPTLPIFYDLEEWTWTGHTPPTEVSVYESIVSAYVDTLKSYGIGNVNVYSYTSYLQGPLNSPKIWRLTSWVAQYNYRLTFANPYEPSFHGWQYTSSASIPGIIGGVDQSAFTPFNAPDTSEPGWQVFGGRTYYYDARGEMVRGWLDLDGKRYRLDIDDGHLWTGWYTVDGLWYRADDSGAVTPGWASLDGRTYYYDARGEMVRGWLDLDGKRYRLDIDDGQLWTGAFTVDGRWVHAAGDGVVKVGWHDRGGRRYYSDPEGFVL